MEKAVNTSRTLAAYFSGFTPKRSLTKAISDIGFRWRIPVPHAPRPTPRLSMNTSTLDTAAPQQTLVKPDSGRSVGYCSQFLKTTIPFLIADIAACFACFVVASSIASLFGYSGQLWISPRLAMLSTASIATSFLVLGLYSGIGMNPIYEFRQCMIGVTAGYIFVAASHLTTNNAFSILLTFPLMLATIWIARALLRNFLSKFNWWGVPCIVFGCDNRINRLYPMHQRNTTTGFRPVGMVQSEFPQHTDRKFRKFWLGTPEESTRLRQEHNVHVAVVHRRGRTDNDLAKFIDTHLDGFTQTVIVPDDDRIPSLWSMGQDGGLIVKDRLLMPSCHMIKRCMDVAISGSVLVLGFPFFVLLALWMKVSSPGPLFFGHERIGRDGRRFKAWKFRSMCVNANEVLEKTLAENPEMKAEWEATQKLQNDPRVTSSGRFLRKTSLDEIPQLWNVLVGEMSLVGPRPIVANEVEKYSDKFQSYTRVTPGVTGFWQISGRNLTSYDRRVELDDYYVRNWSVWFDLYILGRTIKTVLFREGAF